MNRHQIQAIGHFLSSYDNDLKYISKFQDFKNGNLKPAQYVKKVDGSFYKFLIEFRVIRNIPKGQSLELLKQTKHWIDGDNPNEVDSFAKHLQNTGLSPKLLKSMASKVLFLNNPEEIIPMDTMTRKSLSVRKNIYAIYFEKLENFKANNSKILQEMMLQVEPLISQIHVKYKTIENLDTVAQNRMVDKLLWTIRS